MSEPNSSYMSANDRDGLECLLDLICQLPFKLAGPFIGLLMSNKLPISMTFLDAQTIQLDRALNVKKLAVFSPPLYEGLF